MLADLDTIVERCEDLLVEVLCSHNWRLVGKEDDSETS